MRRSLDRFQVLALVTTAATYALIAVGGLVRASGSGLGCPDWPRCFDRWIPPLHVSEVPPSIDPALFNFAKAWTEYTNRLLGVLVGFLIFATLVYAIRAHRRSPRILIPTILAFVLVGVEGWIGGKVVASKLSPAVLTVHLVGALAIVSLLLYATVSAFFPGGRPVRILPPSRRLLGRATIAVGLFTLGEVGLGAAVRGEVQLAATSNPGSPRTLWLELANDLLVVHKGLAPLVGFAVLLILWLAHRPGEERDPWLRGAAIATFALTLVQVALGAGLAGFALPPVLQVLHLWTGTLILGALTVLGLLAYRIDPRRIPGS